MRVVALPEILAAIDEGEILAALEEGFRRFAAGEVDVMVIGHLGFASPPGDCHVKGACVRGDAVFVVKLATSFYRNPTHGLDSSNGFMTVVSATTGEVLAILHDRGRLTDLRTALAGTIAARLIAKPGASIFGIVGAGTQARLQAESIRRHLGIKTLLVWARDSERAKAFAAEFGGTAVPLDELCRRADVIVTTTPSTAPLITSDMVPPGTRIVAVGADAPEKCEIAPEVMARARIVADSVPQCVDHGDTSGAFRAGLVRESDILQLGALLEDPIGFADEEIVIADLTGVAIQDVQIAKTIWARLSETH